MNEAKKIFYENQAKSIINKLKPRKMEGYYCEDKEAAKAKVLELIGEEKQAIGVGGSVTVDELGLKETLAELGHEIITRQQYSPEEYKTYKAKLASSDTFLMSTNALTLDGQLVNIDGRGNRLASLIFGPDQVIVIAGMNKIVTDVEDGIKRVRNIASPANTVRLNYDTPCRVTGQCGNCFKNTICGQIVVTRASMEPGRIKVILVGEELGY